MKRRLLLFLILLFVSLPGLFSASASAIYFASDSELMEMCRIRGLETGTREEMQRALYNYEGVATYTEEASGSGAFDLSVLSAESLITHDSSMVISGNAHISFTDSSGNVSDLSADMIIIDTDNELLTALDNVIYSSDDEDASIQSINADIVTLFWTSGEIRVSDATTTTERESEDGEAVTIYTSGSTLTYTPGGSILYDRGIVASDVEDPYSSITASKMLMLPGADMFISNAYVSIGRVPVLYLPFFFFPGSQMLGNPSFGFTSSQGAFINTTFELLGTNPTIGSSDSSSSFTSLTTTTKESQNTRPTGSYYSSSGPISNAEQWASSTSSYISLLADAYEDTGMQLGVTGEINLFSSSLSLAFTDAVAVSPESSYYNGRLRYYGMNSLRYSGYGISATLSVPFYSDSRVLMDFGNRLTDFSLFSLLETPTFPENYTSTITTFSRTLTLSYSLPSSLQSQYLSSLSISSLQFGIDYRWNSSELEYYMEEANVPNLSATFSGTLFSLTHSNEIVLSTEKEEEYDITDLHLLTDPLLYDIYEGNRKRQASTTRTDTYTASLRYSVSETLKNDYDFNSSGENTDGAFSSDTSLRLTFDASAANWVSLTAVFTPSYSYLWEDDDTAAIVTQDGTISSDMTLSFPFIGLTYKISSRLLDAESVKTGDAAAEVDIAPLGWDTDTITAHSLTLSHAFTTDVGTFTPSVSYTLPPLNAVLTPRIAYSYGPFALSFGWSFREEDSASFHSDLIELSIGYSGTYITSSIAMKYDSEEYDPTDFWIPFYGTASFSLRTADKNWSITEYIDYEYDNGNNYFNELTTTFKIPFFELALTWAGSADEISFSEINATLDIESLTFQLWKGRIYVSFGLESTFSIELDNPYAASFSITPSITFSIAEFLDFKFSFTSVNNGFYNYIDDNGSISLSLMFEDLLRSFDFIGDGRYNTSFVLDEASLEITHYMKDWNFSFKYTTQVVLSDDVYEFRPKVSVYLSWKTIPDLNVDQNWEKSGGVWSND